MTSITYTHEKVAEIAKLYPRIYEMGMRLRNGCVHSEFERDFASCLLKDIPRFREVAPIEVRNLLVHEEDLGDLEDLCRKLS